MLRRKMAMAVFTAAMSSGAFAEMNDSADNASMYQELQALKAQVAMLQSQIDVSQQHKNTQNSTDVTPEDSSIHTSNRVLLCPPIKVKSKISYFLIFMMKPFQLADCPLLSLL